MSPGVVAERSADRVVVLHADGDHVSTLNPVGSLVWDCLPADHAAILGELGRHFEGVDPLVIASDLDTFIDEMVGHGLIVVDRAAD